jgi:hypothetical protein
MSKSQSGLGALLSKESLTSLQVAAGATLLVPNVLVYLIGPEIRIYEKWVALGVAMLIAAVVTEGPSKKRWTWWVVALLNGLLIYASAVGLTEMLSPPGYVPSDSAAPDGGRALPFFHSWYP